MMLRALCVLALVAAVAGQPCKGTLPNTFNTEKGNFTLSWQVVNQSITIQYTLPGTAFIGIGFGGSMDDTDMVLAWVQPNGTVYANDFYSFTHEMPHLDTSIGGVDNIVPICGSVVNNVTTVRFSRLLNTSDKYDTVINVGENDIVYAWLAGIPGHPGFHGDNHNHVRVDFSVQNGVPNDQFGGEETGLYARMLVNIATYGTLVTLQTQNDAGKVGMANWPYGSVAGIADEIPSSGSPLILLSTLERNIINFNSNPACSLAIQNPVQLNNGSDVMASPRTTLLGTLNLVPQSELAAAQKTYMAAHPESAMWIDFPDFSMYRFNVSDVYFVGGFGNEHYIGFISAADYYAQKLSPLYSTYEL